MFKPAKGKVFIKKRAFDLVSRGGIYYPGTGIEAQKRKIIGEVIAVADDIKAIAAGDIVSFNPMAGMEIVGSDHFDIADDGFPICQSGKPSDSKAFCVLPEDEIFAIIEGIEPGRVN